MLFSLCECFLLQGKGYCLVGAGCLYKLWLALQNFVGGARGYPSSLDTWDGGSG